MVSENTRRRVSVTRVVNMELFLTEQPFGFVDLCAVFSLVGGKLSVGQMLGSCLEYVDALLNAMV